MSHDNAHKNDIENFLDVQLLQRPCVYLYRTLIMKSSHCLRMKLYKKHISLLLLASNPS